MNFFVIFIITSILLSIIISIKAADDEVLFFKPFNVSYDHRAIIINGQRRMLISSGIHYPRATPQMWPDLIAKSKEGGADLIQTYAFWNGHEPVRGQYNFEGRYDIVKFVKLVGASGLYFHLRIGPYVCAEWNFVGFPVWLRDIPGIEFRTDNEPFKVEMQRFVEKMVNLMYEENLFSWQGGPIILLQIENEYGNMERSYGQGGKDYVKWAAKMASGLGAGVPWVMCKQTDAPENMLDACNGFYCDGFKPNAYKKPTLWTEDWNGWYTSWGARVPHRPVEDIAFAVARFYQRGGSYQNYYMYFGGTNFGRTAGGPFYITSYDYDAPIDEYGLLSQPKWGHLKELHAAIKLCEPSMVAVDDSPQYIRLGPKQEAHVYRESGISCSAFLANIDERNTASVTFLGKVYSIPPWSVSILPDCANVAFNTAKVRAQTSVKTLEFGSPRLSKMTGSRDLLLQDVYPTISKTWMTAKEPIGAWSKNNFTVQGILEHVNVTKDTSDYLWCITSIQISDEDLSFWEANENSPSLVIESMRDVVQIFLNGQFVGSKFGRWVRVVQPLRFVQGYNELAILSETVGLQNYGAFLEKDGAGFRGKVRLTDFKNGEIDLSASYWTYQVGLQGESMKVYEPAQHETTNWVDLSPDNLPSMLTWYKTYFDVPDGIDPISLDLGSMGKGQAWVNGHNIGRYWSLVAPKNGCSPCDYRGAYNEDKCTTNCGQPTQTWYHIPRAWVHPTNNSLVLFEETGGNPLDISIQLHYTKTICGRVSETDYPPLHYWEHQNSSGNAPEIVLQCDDGHVISEIVFASYGTPRGSCEKFSTGDCHAPNSQSVVSEICGGKNSCSIDVSNALFGSDPCRHTVKTLAVEAKCALASSLSLISSA
ncbi:Beta-galactosidase 9 [Ranunculus cassubicifolius]